MSRLYLAGAGAGKTTFLLNLATNPERRALYTTFTNENVNVATESLIESHGCIPANTTLLPWYSFLLEHGARPFQGAAGFGNVNFTGVHLEAEGINYNPENTLGHFCDSSNSIYPAKLPKLALYCNRKSEGAVIDRLSKIYDLVLIDEVQDLAGYDFDFIAALMKQNMEVILCGDRRQSTYQTNYGRKHSGKDFSQFLIDSKLNDICPIDTTTLNRSYRCSPDVINFANLLYPDMPATKSCNSDFTREHSGIWMVPVSLASNYIESVKPVVLRNSIKTKTVSASAITNFGKAKGRTYDDVLIYPVKDVKNWLMNHDIKLSPGARSKFYVAITRARYSVGIVVPDSKIEAYPEACKRWTFKP